MVNDQPPSVTPERVSEFEKAQAIIPTLGDPCDLQWALERVATMAANAYINAKRFGVKLLKGFGYPDEQFSEAADARALSTVLSAIETLRQERDEAQMGERHARTIVAELQAECARLRARIAEAIGCFDRIVEVSGDPPIEATAQRGREILSHPSAGAQTP